MKVSKHITFLLLMLLIIFASCSDSITLAGSDPVDISPLMDKIEPGQTYAEVREILGKDGKAVGSGLSIYVWDLGVQDVIVIWFDNPKFDDSDTKYPDDLIVSSCEIEAREKYSKRLDGNKYIP